MGPGGPDGSVGLSSHAARNRLLCNQVGGNVDTIAEPPATAETIPVATIDFFLVPLLACDQYGTRLGYGGGYYDRLPEGAVGCECGLGFNFQKVADLPGEQHDVRMQAFLSESGFEIF